MLPVEKGVIKLKDMHKCEHTATCGLTHNSAFDDREIFLLKSIIA